MFLCNVANTVYYVLVITKVIANSGLTESIVAKGFILRNKIEGCFSLLCLLWVCLKCRNMCWYLLIQSNPKVVYYNQRQGSSDGMTLFEFSTNAEMINSFVSLFRYHHLIISIHGSYYHHCTTILPY